MLAIERISDLPDGFAETAVTIGKFDGIHLGHKKLLSNLVTAADEHMLASVVVTFDRHPDALFKPESAKLPLIGPGQKLVHLEESGVDAVLTLPFDHEFAALSARDFVQQILVDGLHARLVLVGEDFRFGAGGAGTPETLKVLGAEFGFVVRVISSANIDGVKVSTTRIRELLDQGDVTKAAELLGRNHYSAGVIEHGLKIGRTIGFPTANMTRECEGYLPLDGVYAGWLYADGEKYPAAHSVGINETFQAVPRLVESHVIDRLDLDLYDKFVVLEFVAFIRPAAKFDGVEALVEEIHRDLDKCRKILEI
jgi:riboflavin kinase / FMN adenylyltransferase